jgi:hypothetical protein
MFWNECDFVWDTRATIKELKELSRVCEDQSIKDVFYENNYTAYLFAIKILKNALRRKNSDEQTLLWHEGRLNREQKNEKEQEKITGD